MQRIEMKDIDMEKLPRETLLEIIKMYARDWLTVDGLWFQGVEEKCGMDVAMELDVRMWNRYALIEAKRIKETLKIEDKGLDGIMKAIPFITCVPAMPFYYEVRTPNRAVIYAPHCIPQEARIRQGKGEFPCRPAGDVSFARMIEVFDPSVKVRCIECPPGPHPKEYWCKWEFTV